MNKVVTINLNGRAYQLEESGYEALRAYLDEASKNLADDPGKTEIIADLEQAIAEKCDKLLNPNKTVVSSDEVKKIIDEMGPVEANGKESAAGTGSSSQSKQAPKRFFLSREGAVFAGVCAGLAAYFDVDVTLVRIIFIALTVFTGGIWILFYLALALLVPYADTAEARAQARGEAFNAENLVQRAKERWGESYERVTGEKWDDLTQGLHSAHDQHRAWRQMRKEQRQQQKQQWKQQWRAQRYQWRRSNPVLGLLRGLLAVLWIVALFSLVKTGTIFGVVLPGVPVWVMLIGLFVLFFAVTGPMKTAQVAPYWSGDPNGQNYYWAYSEWDGLVDGIIILFLVIAFVWAYTQIPQVYFFFHHPIIGSHEVGGWIKSWF